MTKLIGTPPRPTCYYAAADFLEIYRDSLPEPRSVDDLRYHLAEVERLLTSGDHASTFDVMAEIDEHLQRWNCAGLLVRQRKDIRGHLDRPRKEQENENAFGGIYIALGKLPQARKAYRRPPRRCHAAV